MSIGDDLKAKGINPKLLLNPEEYIFDIVRNKNCQELKQISEYDINLNIQDENGDSPLILAIDMKEKKIVKLLLKLGADINYTNSDGQTPLMIAYLNNAQEIAEYLIMKGVDISIKDRWGQTAEDIKKSIEKVKENYNKKLSESNIKSLKSQFSYELYKKGEYYFDTGDYVNAKLLFLEAKLCSDIDNNLRRKINTFLRTKEITDICFNTEGRIPTYAEVKNRGGLLSTKRLQQGSGGYFMEAQYIK